MTNDECGMTKRGMIWVAIDEPHLVPSSVLRHSTFDIRHSSLAPAASSPPPHAAP